MSDCIFCKLFEKLDAFLKAKAEKKSCCCGKGAHDEPCCSAKPEEKPEQPVKKDNDAK